MDEQPFGIVQWFLSLGLSQAQFMADPYAIYREWQTKHPIWEASSDQWMLFGYHNVRRVFSEPQFIKGPNPPELAPDRFLHLPPIEPSMLRKNPPEHTRLRALVSQAFQPRHLSRLQIFVESLATSMADTIRRNGGGDLVEEFCFPLPALVIAELLGVPRDDHQKFRAWSQLVARSLDPSQPPATQEAAQTARWELLEYFHDLVAEKTRHPGEDLLTELITASADGDRLSAGELLTMSLLLLVAGHETTSSLLSMGSLALIERPYLALPDGDWSTAVDELLRFTSPVQLDVRITAADVTFGDVTIREGSWVVMVVGAANRDPAVFNDPDQLDLSRAVNPHLAFGRGIHFCLGAALARMEARLAFPILWKTRWKLAGDPVWNPNIVLRSLASLPVEPS